MSDSSNKPTTSLVSTEQKNPSSLSSHSESFGSNNILLASNENIKEKKCYPEPKITTLNYNEFRSSISINNILSIEETKDVSDLTFTKNFNLSKTPNNRYYKRLITCLFCRIGFSSPQKYWVHFFICARNKDIKEEIIKNLTYEFNTTKLQKNQEEFIKLKKEIEDLYLVTFIKFLTTKKNKSGSGVITSTYQCNHKENGNLGCPFYLSSVTYGTGQVNSNGVFSHNHDKNISEQKVSKEDKEKIISDLKYGIPIKTIMEKAPNFLCSARGRFGLTRDYVRYLQKLHIIYQYDKKDSNGTVKLLEQLENDNEIIIYLSKYPGEVNDELKDYPISGFLLAFSFKKQLQWNKNVTTIFADSTFGVNKYNRPLTAFFALDSDERVLPLFFIISDSDSAKFLVPCLKQFKNIHNEINFSEIKYIMSDMAANFFNAVKEAWDIPIIWLYCAWHFKEAVMTRLDSEFLNRSSIKEKSLCETIKKTFFSMRDQLTEAEFLNKLEMFSNLLKLSKSEAALKFHTYFSKEYIVNNKFRRWATFYRIHSRANTNAASESSFGNLKGFLERKNNLRIDSFISTLFKWVESIDNSRKKREMGLNSFELKSTRQKIAEANVRTAFKHSQKNSQALIIAYENENVFVIEDANEVMKFSEESKRNEERSLREEDKNILEKRIQYGRKKETISLAEKFSEFNPSGKYEVKFNGDKFYHSSTFPSDIFRELYLSNDQLTKGSEAGGDGLKDANNFYELCSIKKNNINNKYFFLSWFSCTCLRFLRSKEICIHIPFAILHKKAFAKLKLSTTLPINLFKKDNLNTRMTNEIEKRTDEQYECRSEIKDHNIDKPKYLNNNNNKCNEQLNDMKKQRLNSKKIGQYLINLSLSEKEEDVKILSNFETLGIKIVNLLNEVGATSEGIFGVGGRNCNEDGLYSVGRIEEDQFNKGNESKFEKEFSAREGTEIRSRSKAHKQSSNKRAKGIKKTKTKYADNLNGPKKRPRFE